MTSSSDAAGSDTSTTSPQAGSAESESYLTEPDEFVTTEAANQGLGDAASPAPVETPAPGVPRGGSFPIDDELGVLARLPGSWRGQGFNLIARPDKHENKAFFLELNATQETLQFNPIAGSIPNRGSKQDDISFLGLTYQQVINDAVTNGGLHIEPGIWLNVPPTQEPAAGASIVRLATVPHGNSLLAQGQGFEKEGGPAISPVSSTPVEELTGKPVNLPGYLDEFLDAKLPQGIPDGAVSNPNLVLTEAIKGQTILDTVVLIVDTAPAGGIENIPFLTVNANAISMRAIFWIETVQLEGGTMLQLQYTQTVILNFDKINWPHISVGTLLKF